MSGKKMFDSSYKKKYDLSKEKRYLNQDMEHMRNPFIWFKSWFKSWRCMIWIKQGKGKTWKCISSSFESSVTYDSSDMVLWLKSCTSCDLNHDSFKHLLKASFLFDSSHMMCDSNHTPRISIFCNFKNVLRFY